MLTGAGAERGDLVMPGIELDHMLVSMRAALAGEALGVSIDPPSEYRDGLRSGSFPPDGTDMYVSYLGNSTGNACRGDHVRV